MGANFKPQKSLITPQDNAVLEKKGTLPNM